MTSNYAESFNSKSRYARKYPITTFVDFLRFTLQDWFYKRRDLALAYNSPLAMDIKKQLCDTFQQATSCIVYPLSRFEFYVQDGDRDGDVNLQTKIYSYRIFDLIGLLCVHVLTSTHSRSVDPYTLCSKLE